MSYKRMVHQVLRMDYQLVGQFMLRAADKVQGLPEQRLYDQFRVLDRLAHYSQVGLQFQSFLQDKVGAVGGYGEPEAVLELVDKIGEEASHIVVAERMGGTDAYHLVGCLLVAKDYLLRILLEGKQLFAFEVEGFPHRGQIDFLVHYVQQLDSAFLLEILDLQAHSRLAYLQEVCSPGYGFVLCNVIKKV